tara:strand:+ start:1630 stop:1974 length:345 start_codon:yes stop_codon:yes gene_type:complete
MALPNNTATIATAATLSSTIAKGAKTFSKIFVENFNATGTLTIQGSKDGTTFYDIITNDPAGGTPSVFFSITAPSGSTANFLVSIAPYWTMNLNFMRFKANAVISGSTCTITCF